MCGGGQCYDGATDVPGEFATCSECKARIRKVCKYGGMCYTSYHSMRIKTIAKTDRQLNAMPTVLSKPVSKLII